MRKLTRRSLSSYSTDFLKRRTAKARSAADPRTEAFRLWRFRNNKAFKEIRATLEKTASGIQHCMYCESGEAGDIEHFWPKSRYPLRAFEWTNYLLACSNCNSNHKRNQFPLDGEGLPLLLDPTVDDPREHLEFLPLTGDYVELSSKGRHSINVFRLGRETLKRSRRNAWVSLQELVVRYAAHRNLGDQPRSDDIRRTVCEYPFAGVLDRLLHLSSHPAAGEFIHQDCLDALARYPEIRDWRFARRDSYPAPQETCDEQVETLR